MNDPLRGAFVAFDSGKLPATRELPSRINVAPWGTHDTAKGKIVINETTAKQLPEMNRASNFDTVALDFNHNTVPGSESYQGEPAKVAAHGTPSVVPGEGVILSDLDWTPEGRNAVEGGHYPDLSPTLQLNDKGEAVFLHSAALCRQGAIPGLTLFAAGFTQADTQAAAESLDYRQLLRAILGLDPDASDDEVQAAAYALGNSKVEAYAALSVGDILYSKSLALLCARHTFTPASLKVLSAIRANAADLVSKEVYRRCGATPAKVAALEAAGAFAGGTSEADAEVYRSLGLTPEQIAKHGGK